MRRRGGANAPVAWLRAHGVRRWLGLGFVGAACLACSPAYDWRYVRLDDIGLQALLPCKPDHGARTEPLAGQPRVVRMAGCDAAGATFMVAYVAVADNAQAAQAQAQWYEATQRNLQARPGATAVVEDYRPAGAEASPAPLLARLHGERPLGRATQREAPSPVQPSGNARPIEARLAWFTRRQGGVTYTVHMAVFAARPESTAVDTFFSGVTAL